MPETPVKSWKTTALGVLTIAGVLVAGAIGWLKTGTIDFAVVGAGAGHGSGLRLVGQAAGLHRPGQGPGCCRAFRPIAVVPVGGTRPFR